MQNRILLLFFGACFSVQLLATLESRLENKWLVNNLDVDTFREFQDFLIPNELNPINVKSHLELIPEKGILISTGTERSFIDLALCEMCTGLVGIDINPRVKAYNDFNTLLLRISKDRNDYLSLRGVDQLTNNETRNEFDYSQIVEKIRRRINNNNLPYTVKKYYLDNLDKLARIFFSIQIETDMLKLIDPSKKVEFTKRLYREKYFANANYLFDDNLFSRLQKFAKEGAIIFIIGDINNLQFLKDEKIAVIDVSNIPDYVELEYENDPEISKIGIRVIWVYSPGLEAKYYSFVPVFKDESLITKRKNLFEKLKEKYGDDLYSIISRKKQNADIYDKAPDNSSVHHKVKLYKEILKSSQ